MAGNPGWYIDEGDAITELPRAERWGGLAVRPEAGTGIDNANLFEETPLGQDWGRPRFKRLKASITFHCTPEQLEAFEDLDAAVDGSRLAFWYVPDVDESTAYYVRKQDDFLPKELAPVLVDGELVALSEITLELTGEAEMTDPDA